MQHFPHVHYVLGQVAEVFRIGHCTPSSQCY